MLSKEQQRRAVLIFEAALDQPSDCQDEWVVEQCGADPELLVRVRALLQSDASEDGHNLTGHFVQAETETESVDRPELVGPYRIIEQLGAGGMGVVYKAERIDGTFARTVAIKFVHQLGVGAEIVARFNAERQILAEMQHPNIAQMLDGGELDQRPYLVMEYVDGKPFAHDPQQSTRNQLKRFCKVCDALSFAHSKLVLHRDIKPSNVLITAEGEPKLLDFGVAKITDLSKPNADLTGIMGMPVTPNYCPPEYLGGETATVVGEIYSLGVLLHEVLIGCVPHDVASLSIPQAYQLVSTSAVIPSSGDHDLDLILGKALHVDPQRRYLSVEALRQDIDNYLSNRPISARRDELGYTIRQFVRRNKALATVGFASAVLLLAAATATSFAYLNSEASRVIAEAQTEQAEKTLAFFITAMSSADPYNNAGKNPTISDALSFAEERMEQEFTNNDVQLAVIQSALASIHASQGDIDKAMDYAQVVETKLETNEQDLAAWRVKIYQYLANSYLESSRFEKSIELLREIGETLRAANQADWSAIATNALDLGVAHAGNGALGPALTEYTKVLDIEEAHGPLELVILAKAQNGVASIQYLQGDYESAERHMARAIELMDLAGLGETINGLRAKNNWAILLGTLKQFDKAEKIFQRTLPKLTALLGPSHQVVLWDVTNYARIYHIDGRSEKTIEILEPYIDLIDEERPEGDEASAYLITKLGYAMCVTGRSEDGLALANRALEITNKIYRAGHYYIGEAHALAGLCLTGLARYAEAETALLTGYEIFKTAFGSEHLRSQSIQQEQLAVRQKRLDQGL